MKKFVAMVLAVLAVMSISVPAFASQDGDLYPMTAIVTEINEEEDYFVVRDFNGFEWVVNGVEDWMIGDIASIIMNDMGTELIFDDEIIMIHYSGWLERWEDIFATIG